MGVRVLPVFVIVNVIIVLLELKVSYFKWIARSMKVMPLSSKDFVSI